jgi:hypothetical protein
VEEWNLMNPEQLDEHGEIGPEMSTGKGPERWRKMERVRKSRGWK